jgi:hypothetical protein
MIIIIELLDGEFSHETVSDNQRILAHFEDLRNANESQHEQTVILDCSKFVLVILFIISIFINYQLLL